MNDVFFALKIVIALYLLAGFLTGIYKLRFLNQYELNQLKQRPMIFIIGIIIYTLLWLPMHYVLVKQSMDEDDEQD